MQIKRFEAKTMTAALKMVKDEFGPEAVILSARTLRQNRGLFGAARSSGVEVTAAMDTGWPAYTAAGRMAAQRVLTPAPPEAAGPSVRRGLFHSLNESLRSFAGRRAAPTPASSAAAPAAELAELYHHFLSQAVQPDLASDLIEHINRLPGYDPLLGLDRLRALAGPALQDMGLRGSVETGEPGPSRAERHPWS
jgi:flagellar biosynthesis GTPase FlhF